MRLKEIIDFHLYRLKTLDPKEDFNKFYFNLGFICLVLGIGLWIFKGSFASFLLGVISYAILSYKSIKWYG